MGSQPDSTSSVEDQDDREVTVWLQNNHVVVGEAIAASAVQVVAGRNKYHPVMYYLNSLSWDGVARLDKWLVTYVGAENTEYIRAVGPRWMISGVARVFSPGCKADCVLILEGPQGILKSTTFDVLGGPFYSNDIAAIGTKDAQEQILGVWILELDGLAGVTRAVDLAHVKAFLSRRRDKFRLPYARRSQPHPRQCIFGATTNRDTWQRDETGARRWWPVKCGTIDIDALRTDRDQLWAEARYKYDNGEPYWLDDPSLVEAQGMEAEGRYEPDPWEEEIIRKTSLKDEITTSEVLCLLGLSLEKRGRSEQMRAASVLRHLGWTREREKNKGKSTRRWVYHRPEP